MNETNEGVNDEGVSTSVRHGITDEENLMEDKDEKMGPVEDSSETADTTVSTAAREGEPCPKEDTVAEAAAAVEAVMGLLEQTKASPNASPDFPRPVPMPLPDSGTRVTLNEIPGAHAVGASFVGDIRPRTRHPQVNSSAPQPAAAAPEAAATEEPPLPQEEPPLPQVELQENDHNLAEAQLVDEEEGQVMGEAQPMQPREDRSLSKNSILCLIGGVLIVVAVCIMVAVTVTNRGSDDTTSVDDTTSGFSQNSTNETLAEPATIPPSPFLLDLPHYTLEALQSDTEKLSPQSLAYEWMLNDASLEDYSTDRQLQRFALAVFYYAMNGDQWEDIEDAPALATNNTSADGNSTRSRHLQFDPTGPKPYLVYRGFDLYGCRRLQPQNQASVPQTSAGFGQGGPSGPRGCKFGSGSSWLSYDTNECDWFNQHDPHEHDTCDGDGVFSILYLSGHGLQGSLPKELALLTGMTRFFVDTNAITGTLPVEVFQRWSRIKDFWVRNNHIGGTLPDEIKFWQGLERFNIFGNSLTGTIPSGAYNLPKLKQLALLGNQLTGTIAGDLLRGLKSIQVTGWGGNRLTGTIPTEFGLLTTMWSIAMEFNDLTGSIPTELGLLTSLEYLTLGKNDLSGTLPSELGKVALNLTFSVRDNTRLTGSIPSELGAVSILDVHLEGTELTGAVPPFWV